MEITLNFKTRQALSTGDDYPEIYRGIQRIKEIIASVGEDPTKDSWEISWLYPDTKTKTPIKIESPFNATSTKTFE